MNSGLKAGISILAAAMLGLALVARTAADDSNHAAIVTASGPLKGITSGPVNEYLGIPYAAPPLGALRWLPTQRFGRWHGVLQATQFGSECPQLDFLRSEFGSENCLFLNVYAPKLKRHGGDEGGRGLPVMVWIHGGGLVTGGGDLYDPTPLVEQGSVIVVTINYRLGLLGFFAQTALDAEGHLNANYGLMDQQFALKWVRRNIAAFGGDRNRVTIFGESAGGESVHANLASPTGAGLFQRAIAESGSYLDFQDYFNYIVPVAQGETTGTALVPSGAALATTAGCSSQTAACLRGLPTTALVGAQPAFGVEFPFVDGTVLTQTPDAAFASGQFNLVPVISGGNHDEWRFFVAEQYDYLGNPLTDAGYQAAVAALEFLPVSDPFVIFLVTVAYPLTNYPPPPPFLVSAPLALGALGTDQLYACPERNADKSLSQYVTTYTYEFNDENAPLNFGLTPVSFPFGAYHTAEIQYLMNIFGIPAPFTPDQQLLSKTMISYWTHFAKTGDPNSASEPRWSPYSSITDEFQSLVPPTPAVESSFDSEHQCSTLWNTF